MKLTFIDEQQLKQAFEAAFRDVAQLMGIEFTKSITSDIWRWKDGGNRDIVDTGRLRDSMQIDVINSREIRFTWAVEYSAAVHEGAVFKNGTTFPARPWTRHVMQTVDFQNAFSKLAKRYMETS